MVRNITNTIDKKTEGWLGLRFVIKITIYVICSIIFFGNYESWPPSNILTR